MNGPSWLWNRASRSSRRSPRSRRFSFESLETRRLLAIVHIDGATGNDATGDGSAAAPYQTIGKGVTEAVANDELLIAGGDYDEAVVIDKNLIVAADGPVTANSWNTEAANTVTLDGVFVADTSFDFNGPALVRAATQLTGANVQFLGTLNSALAASPQALTVSATTLARFGNAAADTVGATAALSALNVTSAAVNVAASQVRTNGNTTVFNGPLVLNNDLVVSELGAGDVLFNGTVNSDATPRSLTVNTAGGGATRFAQAVGGVEELSSLTLNSPGATQLAANVSTIGAQTYSDAVTLQANVTLVAASVNFNSTINSDATARSLRVESPGETRFAGLIGATSALFNLQLVSGGTTVFAAAPAAQPTVTTSGDQLYADDLRIAADTTLVGANVGFGGNINSFNGTPRSLAVNASGTATFGNTAADEIGNQFALSGFSSGGGGDTVFNMGAVRTDGNTITFTDPVVLTADLTVTEVGPGNISFLSTVDSDNNATPRRLTVNTEGGGDTIFEGVIGGVSPLRVLETDEPGNTIIDTANIFTNGASITFNDPVILNANLTINEAGAGAVSFLNTVDSDGTPRSLRVETPGAGNTVFADAVGATSPLLSLRTVAPGATIISAPSITTTGDQDFEDAVNLNGTVTVFQGANVRFLSTLDSTTAAAVTVNTTPAGLTRFVGAVGATDRLGSLTTNNLGTTSIEGGVVNTTGTQLYQDPVTVTTTTIFESLNADVRFDSTLNASAANQDIFVNAPLITRFGGAVGNVVRPRSLETDLLGETRIAAPTIDTALGQTFNDAVFLEANTVLNSTAGNIMFQSTVDSLTATARSLRVETPGGGNTFFVGSVGATNPLLTLRTVAPGTTFITSPTVVTTGDQDFEDAVVLNGAATTFQGANVRFLSTLDSTTNTNVTVNTTPAGLTRFVGAVGATGRLGSLTTNALGTTSIEGGVVNTVDDQRYFDPVTIAATTTFDSDAGDVDFDNTLNAAAAGLDVFVNSPADSRFGGNVGDILPPRDLTTDAVANDRTVFGNAIILTSRNQTYNDRVVLTGDATTQSTGGNVVFILAVDAANNGVAGTSDFGLTVIRTAGTTSVIFNQPVGGNGSGLDDPDGVQYAVLDVNGPLDLIVNMTATELIAATVREAALPTVAEDLNIFPAVAIRSLGDINFQVADDIVIAATASVIATNGTLTIAGDVGNNEDQGTTIDILGQTGTVGAGTQVNIVGGPDDDFFNLQFPRFRAGDNIRVDGAGNSGATFNLITEDVNFADPCTATITTASSTPVPIGDSLDLFDTGQAADQLYNLDSARLARAGGASFQFTEIQQIDLFAGTGADQLFATMPGLPSVVRFNGGGNPAGTADQLDIIGSAGNDLITVGEIGAAPPSRPFETASVEALRVMAGGGDDVVVNHTPATALLEGQGGNDTLIGGPQADVIYGGFGVDELYGLDGGDYLFPDHDFNGTVNGILTIDNGDFSAGGNPLVFPGDAAAPLNTAGTPIANLDRVCGIERLVDGGTIKDVLTWLNAQILPVGLDPATSEAIADLMAGALEVLDDAHLNTLPPLMLSSEPNVIENPDFDHWLGNLYQALLGRDFGPAERQYYVNAHAAGVSRDDIVQGFLNSPERRGNIVADWYARYLGRALDAGGRAYWLSVWAQSSAESVEAGILGSGEYFQRVGGTNAAWVDAMYAQVLGRTGGAAEKQFWVDRAQSSQRPLLSQQFVNSDEHRLLGIGSWYRNYLGRTAETAGAQFWLQKQKTGLKPERIQSSILTSLEFQKMVW